MYLHMTIRDEHGTVLVEWINAFAINDFLHYHIGEESMNPLDYEVPITWEQVRFLNDSIVESAWDIGEHGYASLTCTETFPSSYENDDYAKCIIDSASKLFTCMWMMKRSAKDMKFTYKATVRFD